MLGEVVVVDIVEGAPSCARFRPAIEMSLLARKPDGVRAGALEDSFRSLSRAISRSALALSRFSSWVWIRFAWMEGGRLTIRRVTSGVAGEMGFRLGVTRGGVLGFSMAVGFIGGRSDVGGLAQIGNLF